MVYKDFGSLVWYVLECEITLRPYHMVPHLPVKFFKSLKINRNSTRLIVLHLKPNGKASAKKKE